MLSSATNLPAADQHLLTVCRVREAFAEQLPGFSFTQVGGPGVRQWPYTLHTAHWPLPGMLLALRLHPGSSSLALAHVLLNPIHGLLATMQCSCLTVTCLPTVHMHMHMHMPAALSPHALLFTITGALDVWASPYILEV